ncbi:hypothetical protein KSF78_0000301 [Schistosoma japonicum]|nr:hypothetical protein KSF78_0000301 [Schistosoma japonicum]
MFIHFNFYYSINEDKSLLFHLHCIKNRSYSKNTTEYNLVTNYCITNSQYYDNFAFVTCITCYPSYFIISIYFDR